MKNVTKLLTRFVILTVFSTLSFLNVGFALDTQFTIGTGALTYNIPFDGYYNYGRAQYLYTASEMTGLTAGEITKLGFYISANAGGYLDPLTISVKNTSATALGAGFDETGFTTVWTGYWDPPIGWYDFNLTTPFVWDGVSNVIINICFDGSAWGGYTRAYHTAMPNTDYCRYFKSDVTLGCTATTTYTLAARLNVRMTQPGGTLSGTVISSNTGLPLAGATVSGGGATTTTIANGTYTMDVYSATNNFTASFPPNYVPKTKSALVPSDGTATLDFTLSPIPAVLEGIVTNAVTLNPVKGARVEVEGNVTYTIEGGFYSLDIFPGGIFPATFGKAGFSDSTTAPITLTPGVTVTHNIAIREYPNKPAQPFIAALNGPPATLVNLNWGIPKGDYELIYDDGIIEYSTVWGAAGNMNAVKFTALAYPITTIEGKVNIGEAADYPDGTNPATLTPFTIQVYDASGPGGTPGLALDDPIEVTPTNFGWNTFTLPDLTFASGDFFLVMTQVGVPPSAARLAVDTTDTQLRSYSRYVTGGGPWLPAMGNFMIRATVNGLGGPIDAPGAIVGYQVYRLLQGQEGTPTLWTSVGTPTGTTTVDNSWPSLGDQAYRWAVKAKYTGNRWSDYTFSNVLGKNWTAPVTVNVYLTCDALTIAGTEVTLQNVDFDSTYTATLTTNTVVFPTVWKGNYLLTVERFGFDTYTLATTIMGPKTLDVSLLESLISPTDMNVEDVSLLSTWNAPNNPSYGLEEDFSSGTFETNGWVTDVDNWYVSGTNGNPAPGARCNYSPVEPAEYDFVLTSREFTIDDFDPYTPTTGNHLKLLYDIYYYDWAGNEDNGFSVEILNGTTWESLAEYTTADGDIPWTSEEISLPDSYLNNPFKLRFRAWGYNSDVLMYWVIDNIYLVADGENLSPCILAYNVYLKNLATGYERLSGVSPETSFSIPGNQVVYGVNYEACVVAVYGSGYSQRSCDQFTSHFLYPPRNLEAEAIECHAYLTWNKPEMLSKVKVPAFKGTVEHNTASSIGRAPQKSDLKDQKLQQMNAKTGVKGSIAFGSILETVGYTQNLTTFDIDDLSGYTIIAPDPDPGGNFVSGVAAPANELNWVYGTYYGNPNLYQIDKATGASTLLGTLAGAPGTGFNGITVDKVTGEYFGNDATNDQLWSIDPVAKTATLIGSYVNSGLMIAISFDGTGNLWGYDLINSEFFSIDKTTGLATSVGSIGFTANYAQSMFYDQATDNVIMASYSTFAEIRAVDVTTGASVVLSSDALAEVCSAFVPITGGGGEPAGIQGYVVYRDGVYRDYVDGKDNTEYYDYTVSPGLHVYDVSAYYDLAPYGFPGYAESMVEGPDTVDIICGRSLPFFEPWDQASFAYNDWDAEGNWNISTFDGNPVPSADFSWTPIIATDYSRSITTPALNANAYTCATIWLDFDYKLVDRNQTGDEKLTIEVYKNGAWSFVKEFANNGSVDWTSQHLKLKETIGTVFMVRFNANGLNSSDILHWYVDNIHIYAVCTPPTELVLADISNRDVYLSWTGPNCSAFASAWITWCDGTMATSIGTNTTTPPSIYNIAARWTPDLLPAFDGGEVSKIRFWPSSSGVATYNIRVWEGADAGTLLVDQAVPTVTLDDWNEVSITAPVAIDVTKELWVGVLITETSGFPVGAAPGPAVAGFGDLIGDETGWVSMFDAYGLNYNWDLEAYIGPAGKSNAPRGIKPSVQNTKVSSLLAKSASGTIQSGSPRIAGAATSSLLGYNVFRSDDGKVTWNQLNTSVIPDTTYADMNVAYGEHFYYVNSVFAECTSDSSNVIKVDVITGIDPLSNGAISVYPNPATEVVNVKSDYVISQIQVMNYVGQIVYNKTNLATKISKIDVAALQSGVYFVKITTSEGVRTVKITVTK